MLSKAQQVFEKLGTPESNDAFASIEKFITWRNSKSFDDFLQIEWRGTLKSKDIASQIQEEQNTKFSKSALTQNKWVRYLRDELESQLRENQILPELTASAKKEGAKGSQDNPKTHDAQRRRQAFDAEHLKRLEEENMQLKERLLKLEDDSHIKRNIYADLAEMGANFSGE